MYGAREMVAAATLGVRGGGTARPEEGVRGWGSGHRAHGSRQTKLVGRKTRAKSFKQPGKMSVIGVCPILIESI